MDTQEKWNKKYLERIKLVSEPPVNPRLRDLSHYFSGGKALDLACGLGGNSLFLAKENFHVEAIDISDVAIDYLTNKSEKNNLPIAARVGDLTELGLVSQDFDTIVITYYLDRSLFSFVKKSLRSSGYFFMETYSEHQVNGISDQYKLRPKELLEEFADWNILFFEENEQEGRQTIFCRKP